jgi:Zn-dependent M28 family amino/carboxypeptidase
VNREITFELHPEAGSYYRSDHFNFAKAGIPALYTSTGTIVLGKDSGYGKQVLDDYTKNHYHRPSDEYTPQSWTLEGAIDDLQLLFKVGKKISSTEKWPEWKTDSEFKAIRDKQR